MILFFDRNIGTVVPRVLQWKSLRFPIQVQYHQQHFTMEEQDDIWLNQVGRWGWTVIGHDSSYHKKASELSAIKQYQIGCFYLWGSEARRWEKLKCFARAYDRITEAKAFRGHKMTMEELSHKLNTLLEANDYPVFYEYKEYLGAEAEAHVKRTFNTYQAQLKAGKIRKQLKRAK